MRRILPPGYSRAVLIGKGAFGTVFRVRQDDLGRWVALKEVPHGDSAARSEAQALASAPLSCLPTVYEVVAARRSDWIAMEYVHGVSIRDAIAQSLDPSEAAALAVELVRSLSVLHRSGRSHGDLKPENLIAEPNGRVRLLDLGLASCHPESLQGGSVGYLAPERGWAGCDSRRADMWSLGVVLHEMLVGARPSAQEGQSGWKRLSKEWSEWVGLVDSLLREDPASRPASADAILSELPVVEPLARVVLERMGTRADRQLASRMVAEAAYRLRHREPSEALGLLQQALELDPDQSEALLLLPQIRLDTSSPRRAKRLAFAAALLTAIAVVILVLAHSPRSTAGVVRPVLTGDSDGSRRVRIDRGNPSNQSLPLREGKGIAE